MKDISTEAVWRQFGERLWAFLRRRVHDEEVAADLLQETFLKIHRGLGGLEDESRLAPWVYRIARHVIVDHLRTKHPSTAGEQIEALERPQPKDDLNGEVGRWLEGMIQLTPEPTRIALQLSEIEGRPQREVAERLGLSLSGAKSRVQRGRALLKAMLLECCHVELDRRGNILGYERRGECARCREKS